MDNVMGSVIIYGNPKPLASDPIIGCGSLRNGLGGNLEAPAIPQVQEYPVATKSRWCRSSSMHTVRPPREKRFAMTLALCNTQIPRLGVSRVMQAL